MVCSYWFLIFLTCSIFGYICEVIYCYILDRKIVNRGFLHGPYCPIYGVGAMTTILLLNKYYNDPLILFTYAMLVCSIIEYITSYLMEKLFNDKWWDYSKIKYNINGRVCLKNSILFGIAGLAVIYILYPILNKLLININSTILKVVSIITAILFLIDFIITLCETIKLKKQLSIIEKIRKELSIKLPWKIQNKIDENLKKYKSYPKRIINAFPNIKRKHEQSIKMLKKYFNTRK